MIPEFDITKMRAVLLYILIERPAVTRMDLHNLLFLIDMEHYRRFGRPLMGGTYIKREWGAECKELDAVLKDMVRAGEIGCDSPSEEGRSAV